MMTPPPPISHKEVEILAKIKNITDQCFMNKDDEVIGALPHETPIALSCAEGGENSFGIARMHNTLKSSIIWVETVQNYHAKLRLQFMDLEARLGEVYKSKERGFSIARSESTGVDSSLQEINMASRHLSKLKELGGAYATTIEYSKFMDNPKEFFRSVHTFKKLLESIDTVTLNLLLETRPQRNKHIIDDLEKCRVDMGGLLRKIMNGQLGLLENQAIAVYNLNKTNKLDLLTFYVKFKTLGRSLQPFIKVVKSRAHTQTYGLSRERGEYEKILKSLLNTYLVCRLRLLSVVLRDVLENIYKGHHAHNQEDGPLIGVKELVTYVRNLMILERETGSHFFGNLERDTEATMIIIISYLGETLTSFLSGLISDIHDLDQLSELSDFLEVELKDMRTSEGLEWLNQMNQLHFMVQERLVFLLEVSLSTSFKSVEDNIGVVHPGLMLYNALELTKESKVQATNTWDPLLRDAIQYLGIAYSGVSFRLFEKLATRCLGQVLSTIQQQVFRIENIEDTAQDLSVSEDVYDKLMLERTTLHAPLYGVRLTSVLMRELSGFDMNMIDSCREIDVTSLKERLWKFLSLKGLDGKLRLREPISVLDFFTPDVISLHFDGNKDLIAYNEHCNACSIAAGLTMIGRAMIRVDNRVFEAMHGKLEPPEDDNIRDQDESHRRQTLAVSDLREAVKLSLDIMRRCLPKLPAIIIMYLDNVASPFNLREIHPRETEALLLTPDDVLEQIVDRNTKNVVVRLGSKDNLRLQSVLSYEERHMKVKGHISFVSWWGNFCSGLLELFSKFELCLRCELELSHEELLKASWISMSRLERFLEGYTEHIFSQMNSLE